MDFKKKLIILSSICAGLAALFIAGTIGSYLSTTSFEPNVFPGLKTDAVTKIQIQDKNGKLEIRRGNDGWRIPVGKREFIANTTTVESLLKNMSELRISKIASTSQDTWEKFDVDEKSAARVILYSEEQEPAAECFFGKAGTPGYTQFIRVAKSPDVIQANLRMQNTSFLRDWAERRLFPDEISLENIERIRLKSSRIFMDSTSGVKAVPATVDLTFVPTSEKKEGKTVWQIAGKENVPIPEQDLSGIVDAFSRLNADNIVEEPEKLSFDLAAPYGFMEVRLKDGKNYTLYMYGNTPADSGQYYVTNQDKKYVYITTNYTLRNIFR